MWLGKSCQIFTLHRSRGPVSLHRMRFPYPVGPHAVPLFLAPMAGVSESPFRRICRRHGADVVVTEFLSAEGIRRLTRQASAHAGGIPRVPVLVERENVKRVGIVLVTRISVNVVN